jgi:hypothetical protein
MGLHEGRVHVGSEGRRKHARWALLVVLVTLAALVAGCASSSAPLSAAEYRTKALQYSDDLLSAGAGTDAATIEQMSSPDAATRTAAKAAWDKALGEARAAMASIRALVPPAEYQAIHARIVKGVAANDKILTALDPLMAKFASGQFGSTQIATTPEYAAVSAVLQDPTFTADATDFAAAVAELKAASSEPTATP